MSNLSKQRPAGGANRHIAEAQARIAQQAQAVRQLKADGRDTTAAQDLLGVLRHSLDAMKAHREQIMRKLSRARPRPGRPRLSGTSPALKARSRAPVAFAASLPTAAPAKPERGWPRPFLVSCWSALLGCL